MSDNLNEKQSAMDKEEVQKIIDERIARFVEKEKKLIFHQPTASYRCEKTDCVR